MICVCAIFLCTAKVQYSSDGVLSWWKLHKSKNVIASFPSSSHNDYGSGLGTRLPYCQIGPVIVAAAFVQLAQCTNLLIICIG